MTALALNPQKRRLMAIFLVLSVVLIAVAVIQPMAGDAWLAAANAFGNNRAEANAISTVGIWQSTVWGATAGLCFGALPGAVVGAVCSV